MRLKNIKTARGYTILEVMIAVVILSIVAAIAIPAYNNYVIKSRMAGITPIVAQLTTDIQHFYSENGRLPNNSDNLNLISVRSTNNVYTAISAGIINTIAWSRSSNGTCDFFWIYLGVRNNLVNLTATQPGVHVIARARTSQPDSVVAFTCGPFNTDTASSADLIKYPKGCDGFAGTFQSGGTCP